MDYFEFEVINKIASALCSLDGVQLGAVPDPLRNALMSRTGLPFATPDHIAYKVWRNYKRVFTCCMLAAGVSGKLVCTDICYKLAAQTPNDIVPDEYFGHFARRFYYPSPALEGYAAKGPQVFPVSAILKLLLARIRSGGEGVVTVKEVVEILVANRCTGREPVSHYFDLKPRTYTPVKDEVRQIREFVRFISQISFLKWMQPSLYLDVDPENDAALKLVEEFAEPVIRPRDPNPSVELLDQGRTGDFTVIPLIPSPSVEADIYFVEGKPKRVCHLRYERSPKLRQMFFQNEVAPFVCDMCDLNVSDRYPWTQNLLELHHLLPLASPLRLDEQRTSLSQLVAMCPTCHKATHIYYRDWLDGREQDDFNSHQEAADVYNLAKQSVQSN